MAHQTTTIPILILNQPNQILFPHQTLSNLTINPPLSIQLTKLFLSAQQAHQTIHIGCLPLKLTDHQPLLDLRSNHHHPSTPNPITPFINLTQQKQQQQQQQQTHSHHLQHHLIHHAFRWGTIARLTSFVHSTSDNSLKLNLLGTHRFKLIKFIIPNHLHQHTLQAQVLSFDEIPLESASLSSLDQFKKTVTPFILLLTHSTSTPFSPQQDPKPQIDRLITALQPNQLSFLIDLMIRDLQLIPWEDKLEFLSYFNSQLKLDRFIQLISRISNQIQTFNTQSNPLRRTPTIADHQPASQPSTKPAEPILTPQQKELLIRSRLKAISTQFILAVQQLNQLHQTHPSNLQAFHHHPSLPFPPPHTKSSSTRPFSSRPIILGPPRSSAIFGPGGPFAALDSEDDELKDLEKKLQSSGMNQEAFQICSKELKRLRSIQPSSVEHSVIKNYLEIMLELPWSKSTITLTNQALLAKGFLHKARAQLDLDHFGMLKVKQRLIEFLAVIKLRTDLETHTANQQFIASNTDPSTTSSSPSSSSTPNEFKISRLWKDTLDPTFLVQPDHPDRPAASADNTLRPPGPTLKGKDGKKPAPILLLVGPPGVGKTSIARSIAKALNKQFYRISLGGVKDESEIRGHRRTYIGSMPGTIVQALRRVGVNDPVILLDEIDKVGSRSINGDPASALLEVLDPEQNSTFVDHYINTPIDLSSVLFLATANSTSTISPPLLDRLETIQVDGYSLDEKINIARRNLIPKQIKNYSLQPHQFILDDEQVLKKIILSYTSESGVRNLEREIGSLCRAKVLEFIQDRDQSDVLDKTKSDQDHLDQFQAKIHLDDVRRILGPEHYETEISDVELKPGVAIGMAYQGSGNGSILYIEATSYPGKGGLRLTGSLGEVIKESAELAISWIKSNSKLMNLNLTKIDTLDLHIHFPSGSIKKDGPSAGVGLVLALVSLFSNLAIDNNLAVTGEISLRGQILPVGGIREKVLAASRSGIEQILIPAKNAKEIESDENLKNLKDLVEVQYVNSLHEVIKLVFKDKLWTRNANLQQNQEQFNQLAQNSDSNL